MKLWEMLRDGKAGDRFKCESRVESWNDAIYEFKPTSDQQYKCVIRVGGRSTGYILDLCGAALEANWIKLEKPVVKVDFFKAYSEFMNGKVIKPADISNAKVYKNTDYEIAFPVELINGKWIVLEE